MYDKLKELGIKHPHGWLRIWIVASILWMLIVAGNDIFKWTPKKNRNYSNITHSAMIIMPLDNSRPRIKSNNEIRKEKLKKAGAVIITYLGPPVAAPILIILFISVGRWITAGFKE